MPIENLCCQVKWRVIRTTNRQHGCRRFPIRLRELTIDHLHRVGIADFTYLRLHEQFIYLTVLDSYSRRVVGWTWRGVLRRWCAFGRRAARWPCCTLAALGLET